MRDEVLEFLRENQGGFVSGQDMSEACHVSRTAIWKHIKALRSKGYKIESYTKKGYRLLEEPDLLSPLAMKKVLDTDVFGKRYVYMDITESTNLEARKLAQQGAEEGTVVVTEEQSAGRGRLSRGWYSPFGKGIWFSIILRPEFLPSEAAKCTLMAAVALTKAFHKMGLSAAGIKWPNDIVISNKKVCGILAEMALAADGSIEYAVVGIGININMSSEDFGAQLEATATSLYLATGIEYEHEQVLKALLDEFDLLYSHWHCCGFALIRQDWLDYSCTLGHKVIVRDNDTEIYSGMAEDMDDYGSLLVRNAAGKIESFDFGEISIRSC